VEQYWNKGIKEIITMFPPVEKILNDYEIGCVPCNVGTCLLKDIVEIHGLSQQDEENLLRAVAGVIYPGQVVALPKSIRKDTAQSGERKFSPPMKRLVDEHVLIKRLLALVPQIAARLDLALTQHQQLVGDCVDFIRNYADKFHHAKEEDILFKCFDENLDIIQVMLTDHINGRNHVKGMLEGVEAGDKQKVIRHLDQYAALLTEHIKKEDEILYPWMDRNLDDRRIGQLFSQFCETDREFGDAPLKYEKFITNLEEEYKHAPQG